MNLPDFLDQDKYGFVHLSGHRIGLRHIVDLYNDHYSPEMLQDHFPTLTLALIHKVIAYYLENQVEVDTYVKEGQQTIERLAAAPQPGPDAAELRRRMEVLKKRESA